MFPDPPGGLGGHRLECVGSRGGKGGSLSDSLTPDVQAGSPDSLALVLFASYSFCNKMAAFTSKSKWAGISLEIFKTRNPI